MKVQQHSLKASVGLHEVAETKLGLTITFVVRSDLKEIMGVE